MTRMHTAVFIAAVFAGTACGCGYTTSSLLPAEFKSITVENFTNRISVTDETSDQRMYKGYRPGLENDVTRAIVDRYIFDGNLRIAKKELADLVLKGELLDYRREALRYDTNDNVEEYRLRIVVSLELKNARTGDVVWTEKAFSGEATYRTSGSLAQGESAAIKDAVSDLARRVVERTIEGW